MPVVCRITSVATLLLLVAAAPLPAEAVDFRKFLRDQATRFRSWPKLRTANKTLRPTPAPTAPTHRPRAARAQYVPTGTDPRSDPPLRRLAERAVYADGPQDNHKAARHARQTAIELIEQIQNGPEQRTLQGTLLRAYNLETAQGRDLFRLVEAYLRTPTTEARDRLVSDLLRRVEEWRTPSLATPWAWLPASMNASLCRLKALEQGSGIARRTLRALARPAARLILGQAIGKLGDSFILGRDIEQALSRRDPRYRYSFDMLGEGARTATDAQRYFERYSQAIASVGPSGPHSDLRDRDGISLKLSALHPRFEMSQRERVIRELVPKLVQLARMAQQRGISLTIDAEEANRLELTLQVLSAVSRQLANDPRTRAWSGLGLAVQAYQKSALDVIEELKGIGKRDGRRWMVRLVKGAYWDTEIARAQTAGLPPPVWERREHTDLSYLACARELTDPENRPYFYAQLATHSATTAAAVLELLRQQGMLEGQSKRDFEFQRLQGMGATLHDALIERYGVRSRIYAPVGDHRTLLAYLVRRLLENGANSSFVHQVTTAKADELAVDIREAALKTPLPHEHIHRFDQLYGERANPPGTNLDDPDVLSDVRAAMDKARQRGNPRLARPIVAGQTVDRRPDGEIVDPSTGKPVGHFVNANAADVAAAFAEAKRVGLDWERTPVGTRARVLERVAELLWERRDEALYLINTEGARTLGDAESELREAINYCRVYAQRAVRLSSSRAKERSPGPIDQEVTRQLRGLPGTTVAISPWNFPLAIFVNQVAAPLVMGNTVLAKPAEQTPLTGAFAVRLFHQAMREHQLPLGALQLLIGGAEVGQLLTSNNAVGAVAFTGSNETARRIQRSLAARKHPVSVAPPQVFETGGVNPLILDSTALPEQVADHVMSAAFGSAGQRCSSARVVCVPHHLLKQYRELLVGAMRELTVGAPADYASDLGPLIDAEAKQRVEAYIARSESHGRPLHRVTSTDHVPANTVAPTLIELRGPGDLKHLPEVFGPVLHLLPYDEPRYDDLLAAIREMGYGLTVGVESRDRRWRERTKDALPYHGNIYAHRPQIGAVPGEGDFGGGGLSGSGLRSGTADYLRQFSSEQAVIDNLAATGGVLDAYRAH